MKEAKTGLLVRVRTVGERRQEMSYGNHWSVQKYKEEVLRKAMADVEMGRAMVFKAEDGERIHGVVEEKERFVIHDLTFGGPGSKPIRTANEDTDWE